MIRVDNAGTRRLSLITAQNGAQCVVGGSAYDTSTGSYSDLAPTLTTISSATTTSIDTAPASGCINDYDFVNVKNTFAGSHTMTLQLTSGSGGPFPLKTFTLLQDESMNYAHGTGFQFFDANGNLKESLSAATNWGVTGNLTVGGDTTLGDASTDTITFNAQAILSPNRTMFQVTLSTDQLNLATNTEVSQITILFDTETFDIGNNFNTSTHQFTAPFTGKYILGAIIDVSNFDTATTRTSIILNTSNRVYPLILINGPIYVADGRIKAAGTVIADMDAGDVSYITAALSNDGTAQADILSGVNSYFYGALIG